MNRLPNLRVLDKTQRQVLLEALFRIAKRKAIYAEWVKAERGEAQQLRKWKNFLSHIPVPLRKALLEIVQLTDRTPPKSKVEALFDGQYIRNRLGKKLTGAIKALNDSLTLAESTRPIVIALINPRLRTKSERRTIKTELVDRYDFRLGESSPTVDLWFIREAAEAMNEFYAREGKKIKRYDVVIAELFDAAFGEGKTEDSIRKELHKVMGPRRR